MSKDLLLRIYHRDLGCNSEVKGLYSDGLTIEELQAVADWATTAIIHKRAMMPKSQSVSDKESQGASKQ